MDSTTYASGNHLHPEAMAGLCLSLVQDLMPLQCTINCTVSTLYATTLPSPKSGKLQLWQSLDMHIIVTTIFAKVYSVVWTWRLNQVTMRWETQFTFVVIGSRYGHSWNTITIKTQFIFLNTYLSTNIMKFSFNLLHNAPYLTDRQQSRK